MTPAEAAVVLTAAAAFDRRTVDESAAQAWAAALPDVGVDEARDAVVAHYREKREWIMPADIRAHVRRVRAKRLSELPPITPPRELAGDPKSEQAWLAVIRRAVANGEHIGEAYLRACDRFGIAVPGPAAVTGPTDAHRAGLRELMSSTEVDG